jgi:putative ABC transport system permease protein
MAVGAGPVDLIRLVIHEGLPLILIGLVIGVACALGTTQVLSSLLYGIGPTDPLTFIGVSLLLVGVAVAASYIPARRATKVDPMVALRYE